VQQLEVILIWKDAEGRVERDPPVEADQLAGFAFEPRSEPVVVERKSRQWAIVAVTPTTDGRREVVLREQA